MSKKQPSEGENRKYGLHCWAIVRVNLLCNVMNPRKRDYPRRRSDSLSDRPIEIAAVVIARNAIAFSQHTRFRPDAINRDHVDDPHQIGQL